MISYTEARDLALTNASQIFDLSDDGDEVVICEDKTVERENGWVFYYNSKSFLESGDFSKMLMRNLPIFVNKHNAQLSIVRGDLPIDQALKLQELE